MGIVVAARHLRLDERVAIKFLHRRDRPGTPERFLQEGRVAAKLRGEHVARVFDVGEREGALYLVMEYLDGTTLHKTITEGGLASETAGS
jgi:serine/threonine-protein kinase